jgi:hypothetical protein
MRIWSAVIIGYNIDDWWAVIGFGEIRATKKKCSPVEPNREGRTH